MGNELVAAQVQSLGRRERKKLETREALENAALRLFLQQGFDQTTIEDITEAADVARRTFFRYFDSKESVVFANQAEQLEALRVALAARSQTEPVFDAIRAALHELASVHEADRERGFIRARISLTAPNVRAHAAKAREEWELVISGWVADRIGAVAGDLRPALVAGAATAAIAAALGRWIAGGGLEDPADLVNEALDLLESGFGLAESG